MPPQKASKSQPKADASEKTKSKDRDWLTTAELATKIGWREHALRDAMRGKELPGVRRTSFGYHIESASVDEISRALGVPPPKGNAPKRKVARAYRFRRRAGRIWSSSRYLATVRRASRMPGYSRSCS